MGYDTRSRQQSLIMAQTWSRPSKGTSQMSRMDSDDDSGEVTSTNINEVLQTCVVFDDDDVEITLPPHQRCAPHTLNLVSCTDVDKWFLSTPGKKAGYGSATANAQRYGIRLVVKWPQSLWMTISKKLFVPCSTKWNSFYDALVRIYGIPMVEQNTISSKFGLTAITEQ